MDEILIGEKKYVSSKQAAKVTGYAKDYIGQLCREGRVPARLVGRSWYVLESAIHDHRFGEQKSEQEAQDASKEAPQAFPQTWEAPRYSTAPVEEEIPSVNRLRDADEGVQEGDSVSQHLQDSWKAWFDRVADAAPSIPDVIPEKSGGKESEPVIKGEEEVRVPIHTVYQQPPEELLPRRSAHVEVQSAEEEEEREEETPRNVGRRVGVATQVVGAGLALVMALLAVIGSGYFDRYIISNSQVGLVAGVSLYNR